MDLVQNTIFHQCISCVTATILNRMLAAQAQPSEVTYTALLSMWGKSRHPQASQRIVEVFQHMRSAGRTLDTVGYRCATPHHTTQ